MEEIMEMITWSQLGIHDKPVSASFALKTYKFSANMTNYAFSFLPQIGLLNVDGYYNSLLELFDKGVHEGFIKPACRHIVISATNANELLAKMEVRCLYILSLIFLYVSVKEYSDKPKPELSYLL